MKALSIQQPWADLICLTEKTIEVRTWRTHYRGDIVICASAKPAAWMKMYPRTIHPSLGIWCEEIEKTRNGLFNSFYQLGKTICIAELYNIETLTKEHEEKAGVECFEGAFAWHLRNIRELKPKPVKGKLNFFEIDSNTIELR